MAVTDRHGAPETEEDDAELRRRVAAKQTIGQIARVGAHDGCDPRPSGDLADHV